MSRKANVNGKQLSEIASNTIQQEESKSNSSCHYQNQYFMNATPQPSYRNDQEIHLKTNQDNNNIPDYIAQQTQEDDEIAYFTNLQTPKLDDKIFDSDYRNSTQQINKSQTPSTKNLQGHKNKVQSMNINNQYINKEGFGIFFPQVNMDTNQPSSECSIDEQKSTARKNLNDLFNKNKDETTPKSLKRVFKSTQSEDLSKNIQPLLIANYSKNDESNQLMNQTSTLQSPVLRSQAVSKGKTLTGKQLINSTMKLSRVYPTIQYHKQASSVKSEVSKKEVKKWDVANQISRLIRIKNKLRKLIKQRFSALSQYEKALINDLTDSDISQQKLQIQTKSLFKKIISYTFHPGSFPIMFFKACMLIITIYNIYFIPMIVGFDLEMSSTIGLMQTFSGFIFLLEIFINFRTSLYMKGEIISDQKIIAKRYINTDFFFDVTSIIGCALGTADKYFTILTLIRINNLQTYMKDINNHYYLAEKYHKTWTLTRLMVFIVFMAHYFACIFHYIALIHYNDPEYKTWVEAIQIENLSWDVRYNYALYYSFITCITIGYGDITPKNSHERIACIIFAIVSSMIFSYSVNTIGNIFQDYFIKFQKQLLMRYNAIKFLSSRQIGKDLQLRVLKYIEYIHEIENESPEKGLSIINQISDDLKTEVFQEYYGEIIKKNKHFALNYSIGSIQKLALKVQEKVFAPGEIVFEEGDQDGRLYYIIKGECEFYLKSSASNKNSMCQTIFFSNETEFFGYKGFISGIPREMSCRSKNISHVFYVNRSDLINILKEDALDYEQFCKIRDQFLLYTNSLGEVCYGCKNFGHTLTQCPRIHLVKNRDLIALRYNYSADQVRQYRNRNLSKYQRLRNFQLIKQSALQFKKNMVIEMFKQSSTDQSVQDYVEELQQQPEENIEKYFPYIVFDNEGMLLRQHMSDSSINVDNLDSISEIESATDEIDQNENKAIEEILETDESQSDNSKEQIEQTKLLKNTHIQELQFRTDDKKLSKLKKSRSSYFTSDSVPKISEMNLNQDEVTSDQSDESSQRKSIEKPINSYPIQPKNETKDNKFSEQPTQVDSKQEKNRYSNTNLQSDFEQDDFSNQNQLLVVYQDDKDSFDNIEIYKQRTISRKSSHQSNQNSHRKVSLVKDDRIIESEGSTKDNPFSSAENNNRYKKEKDISTKLKLKIPAISSKTQRAIMVNTFFDGSHSEHLEQNDEIDQLRKQIRQGTDFEQKSRKVSNGTSGSSQSRRYSQQISFNKKQSDLLLTLNENKRQSKFKQELNSPLFNKSSSRFSGKIAEHRPSFSPFQKQFMSTSKDLTQLQKGKSNDNQNFLLFQILQTLQNMQSPSIKKNKPLKPQFTKDTEELSHESFRLIPSENNISYSDFSGSKRKLQNQQQQPQQQQQTPNKQIQFHQRNTQILMDLYIFEFDTLKEYQNYFPHNNASTVCKNFKKYHEKLPINTKKRSSKDFIQTLTKQLI